MNHIEVLIVDAYNLSLSMFILLACPLYDFYALLPQHTVVILHNTFSHDCNKSPSRQPKAQDFELSCISHQMKLQAIILKCEN